MAEPRPRTYYTTMLKEQHRAERAEEHAAAFKRRWAEERDRAEAAEAEARALRERLAAAQESARTWRDRYIRAERDVAEALRAATADPTPLPAYETEGDCEARQRRETLERALAPTTPPRTNPLQTQWTRPPDPTPPPETP